MVADQAGGVWRQRFVEQRAQGFKALWTGGHFLTGGQLVEHVDQRFVSQLCLFEEAGTDGQAAFFDRAVQVQ
ncbi:hypothetical protein D3C77_298420 [compost metagenome]